MIKVFLIVALIVGVAFALLCVKIIFSKNGRFPNTHVGASKAMKDRGIFCVQTQDRMEQEKVTWYDEEKKKKDK